MSVMQIKSRVRDYTVEEAPTLGDAVGRLRNGRKSFAIVDTNLLTLPYASELSQFDETRILAVGATEKQKSLENLTWIFSWLIEREFRRDCDLLAIGGGSVQDITCFVASVLLRGVRWRFIPTTLLAQCDSCIGSKSSINIGAFKNQIGTFYPPDAIALVRCMLDTLPRDEIRSGLGEAVKLHLLAGTADFEWLRKALIDFDAGSADLLSVIWSSLRIKQRYIELDEFDQGPRNILNYGHTFGHAYESASNYAVPHGIAVTLGIATATYFSEQLGLVSPGHFGEVNSFLRPLYEPYQARVRTFKIDPIVSAMKLDKKNVNGAINCILTRGFGAMERQGLDPEREVRPLLRKFFETLS